MLCYVGLYIPEFTTRILFDSSSVNPREASFYRLRWQGSEERGLSSHNLSDSRDLDPLRISAGPIYGFPEERKETDIISQDPFASYTQMY